ncbi:hypothetical protein [Anatilimnocola floriformis]|uniref:hypothetical protein n=1 Tax=Anatilimnocola floriformis TaxID=2948575 RepID=UPI0020C48BA3|nr:hypothetical protein [Anatilimnocola floriformis]
MLCKFTVGGPEDDTEQDIADEINEVRCTGLTRGFADLYSRDLQNPAQFLYSGTVPVEVIPPGVEILEGHENIDDVPLPDWAQGKEMYDLITLQPIRPQS